MRYRDALKQAQWEAEQNRPFDWQDKAVIWASVITIIVSLVFLVP